MVLARITYPESLALVLRICARIRVGDEMCEWHQKAERKYEHLNDVRLRICKCSQPVPGNYSNNKYIS